MSYREKFDRELAILRRELEEGDSLLIEPFIEDIYSIIEKFSGQGHSGASAPYASGALADTIKKVLSFQPLSPIHGTDDEWVNVSEEMGKPMYQNNRCSAVFNHGGEVSTYNDAIVFQGEESWDSFTGNMNGIRSSQKLKGFPFVPKTFYIDVVREAYDEKKHGPEEDIEVTDCGGYGKQVYSLKDKSQLDAVAEYYDTDF